MSTVSTDTTNADDKHKKGDTTKLVPEYFGMLDLLDKIKYIDLQNLIVNEKPSVIRNMKCNIMQRQFDLIKKFCIRGDGKDNVRCLVCGMCWLKSGIATNLKQLMCLIPKCKSSFNTTFRYMGISVSCQRGDANAELAEYLPMIGKNITAMRKWSVRNYPDPNYVCKDVIRNLNKKKKGIDEPHIVDEENEVQPQIENVNLVEKPAEQEQQQTEQPQIPKLVYLPNIIISKII